MNIENKKQVATLLLAVALGIVAVVLTSQYVKTAVEEQTMMLAREYEKQNQQIAQSNAGLVNEINSLKGQVNKLSQEVQTKQTVQPGRQDNAPIVTGAFSLRTPKGKRAMTVMIDSLEAVGGLISPGDYVDILGQLNIPSKSDDKKEVTTVLFQNVQILAVGTNFSPQGSAEVYSMQQKTRSLTVTLALSPEEMGLLTFAQSNGKLKLSLRSPVEQTTENLAVASWDELADYVLKNQGTEILVPAKKADIQMIDGQKSPAKSTDDEEVKPFIQIFKGGREL